jgi:hypothetical protein
MAIAPREMGFVLTYKGQGGRARLVRNGDFGCENGVWRV